MPVDIPVPATLRGAHPVVAATRQSAEGLRPDAEGRLDIGCRPGIARLQVSLRQLNRALRILQAVIAEAERRGYEIAPVDKFYNHAAGIGISLRGETYAVWLYELRDKVALTEAEIKRWEKDHEFSLRFR